MSLPPRKTTLNRTTRDISQRILVTGAAGFIGSHLCSTLLRLGDTVVGVDDLSRGSAKNLEANYRFRFLQADVATLDQPGIVRQLGDIDVIFHLAARVGPTYVIRDRLALLREHSTSTLAVLAVAERTGARVVLTSTSEVYGNNISTPFSESDDLVLGDTAHPRWAYAVSKLWCEHAVLGWGESTGGRCVVARLFNTVGARQSADGGLVLPAFASAALAGEPLVIHGDGQQRRSFAHVDDVVAALIALAECDGASGEVVNVGSAHERTIREVASDVNRHVATCYGRSGAIEFAPWSDVPERPARMAVRCANNDKLEALTGASVPDRWPEVIEDVCAWEAERLGVARRA